MRWTTSKRKKTSVETLIVLILIQVFVLLTLGIQILLKKWGAK